MIYEPDKSVLTFIRKSNCLQKETHHPLAVNTALEFFQSGFGTTKVLVGPNITCLNHNRAVLMSTGTAIRDLKASQLPSNRCAEVHGVSDLGIVA